ncbi:MAG: FAD-binding protein [Dehalococcoidia bacterium]|nr:FAD-binding protein [Dehalococcoidia bacterium]
MKETVFEADVLCVGGGIAGLMAAIHAADSGARVIVAEKANTLRSGNGATGNDHFRCYIPEFHGPDVQPLVEEVAHSQVGNARTMNTVRVWMENSFDIVKLWDSWGIPMKYKGTWEFAGHTLPGRPFTTLKYSGQQQKPVLTREARKRGVQIVNRVTVFDLLCESDRVMGAIGLDSRENQLVVFRAGAVILCTGTCVRLYPGIAPGWNFNRAYCAATTGDGRAMAYRAGAELINVEMPQRWAGPKYMARCGKATWVGVVKDPDGKPVGLMSKPDRKYGDAIADAYHTLFADYAKLGKAPLYMDCRDASDEDLDYMKYWLVHEGNMAMLNHMNEEGIDLKKHAVEFTTYELTTAGGVRFNEKSETSLKGLYAAGDEYFGGISAAAVFGWLAGENAANYAKRAKASDVAVARETVDQKMSLLSGMLSRSSGASWQEANIALQQTMQDYAGGVRSETMLQAGLAHLGRLKEKAYNGMLAGNPHELMHCIEVLNLFDVGELVFLASLERKETRGGFIRPDYPYANPLLNNKLLVCKMVNGKPVTEWIQMKG